MVGNTRSRSITEVKQHSEQSVLSWGTRREPCLAQGFFFEFILCLLFMCVESRGFPGRKFLHFRTAKIAICQGRVHGLRSGSTFLRRGVFVWLMMVKVGEKRHDWGSKF